jgi:hypothetical protein
MIQDRTFARVAELQRQARAALPKSSVPQFTQEEIDEAMALVQKARSND